MYNSSMPTRDDLPGSAQLLGSTLLAIVAATAILVTIVLPAEYAIDPTGIGRALKLTDMGKVKQQLAAEALADRLKDQPRQAPQAPALQSPPAAAAVPAPPAQAAQRSDETVFTLKPGEGAEYKMVLPKGAEVEYAWQAEGGVANYEMHGSPSGGGKESSYKAGRGVKNDEGKLKAGHDGSHGWFFRNRDKADVKLTLRTKGPYAEI